MPEVGDQQNKKISGIFQVQLSYGESKSWGMRSVSGGESEVQHCFLFACIWHDKGDVRF